ncbi:MAG: hypothetical protein H5T68_07710 [Chloroflexi bacterium]|nr:hypothetical protein [Chloroflexota bacterium]
MASNGSLTRKQRMAITALLTTATVREAAEQTGIGERTLYRWLAEPAFQQALIQAQGEVLRLSTVRLAGLLAKALDVIGLDFEPGVDGNIRLRAATAVLRHVAGLLEYVDLEGRVSALEQRIGEGEK